ncbi:hypothetical protein G6O69_06940 [Pseudenhygromyxa sp. WMMC2535]|uniref:ArnT family glycosyltransferase n=1 Tax=Pseudenhygromyxa sp. WMMC2535 TaxID=2712867 RepID=UPI001554B28B|nr:hypothetical protein [Pseudenhygromyxa sp. WMMC2535]NVB37562.1 hypothetical protein [Pseudenhygromyxa sp. WMMC2535]
MTPSAPPGKQEARSKHWARHLLALALLAICGVLSWTSERGRTLTADEPLHLIRGQAWLWTYDAQLSYAHPPLANVITALPHIGGGEEPWGEDRGVDGSPDPEARLLTRMRRGLVQPEPTATRAEAMQQLWQWEVANPLRVSQHYFTHDFQRAEAELTTSRRVMMAITLAFALFFYLWTERRYGWTTGILSLALLVFQPTLIAHGRLVTTDIPAMAAVFLSLAATIAWIERPGWARVGWFCLATTVMVLTKHSGLVIVLVLSGMLILAAGLGLGGFAGRGVKEGAGDGGAARWRGWGRRAAVVVGQLAVVAVVMILAIDAAYFFDRVGLSVSEIIAQPEPQNWLWRRYRHQLVERSFLGKLPDPLPMPFPYTWLVGLATVSKQNASGHGGYFYGLNSHLSHPLYFPVMLAVKTPLGVLGLLGLAGASVVGMVRTRRWPSVATGVLAVFALVNLISLMSSHINIGVRHAATLLPIMALFAGRAGALLFDPAARRALWGERLGRFFERPLARAAVLSLCLGSGVAAVATSFPAYLGYFNALAGGPGGGRWISVIGEDWGQDLGDVAEAAEEHGWTRVAYYSHFPLRREALEARGLEVTRMGCKRRYRGPDPMIVHLSDWVRRQNCFRWLEGREPVAFVNYNVLLFAPLDEADEADELPAPKEDATEDAAGDTTGN